jgi:hypothetical protein
MICLAVPRDAEVTSPCARLLGWQSLVGACTLVDSMATRSIVTSQPDVACDMCGRRLLRGEHPEEFLAGAEPRLVCELCAPRATQEGWRRAADVAGSLTLRASGRRRGGSLLGRLRQLRESSTPEPLAAAHEGSYQDAEEFDLSDEALDRLVVEDTERFSAAIDDHRARPVAAPSAARPPLSPALEMQGALEVFNVSEHPRRVSGVARSLGEPTVTVRATDAQGGRRFAIVVAWELCWYRYVVDLDNQQAGALLDANGMELSELPDEDRRSNASADEHGALALLG